MHSSLIHEAIIFAARAHEGQTRKGTDIPYIVHPFEVAQLLTAAGCDDRVIIAGLLHDTLEDTDVTAEQISQRFGQDVLTLIQADSEDKALSWEERKQHTIDYLSKDAAPEELLVACADKLSNMRSIHEDYQAMGDTLWSRFNRGKEQQKWYYSKLIEAFSVLSAYEMYQELCERYSSVFEADCCLNGAALRPVHVQ